MASRKAATRRFMMVCGLALLLTAALVCRPSPAVHALSYALYTLDELAAQSDLVFVGAVVKKEAGNNPNQTYDKYTFRVQIPLRGGAFKNGLVEARVLQWGNEGVLRKGDTYLMFLSRMDDAGYTVSGVHQGFIKLQSGRAESPFYEQEEVDRYLERYGLKVKTIYERFVPEDKAAAPRHSVREATAPGMLWFAGAALAAMLVWLFARARKRRESRFGNDRE